MDFAITLTPETSSWDDILEMAQEVDQRPKFESLWTGDHFYAVASGDPEGPRFEAWTLLAAIAQATTRVRVGTLVSAMLFRHPAVVANMATTVDAISGGRLELGLGAGWAEPEIQAYGFEGSSQRELFDRFEEGLTVIDSLLRNRYTDFDGAYFQIRHAVCAPGPVQQPRPPFSIGGVGPRRTLPLVARYAQHWNFPAIFGDENVHKLQEARERLALECERIGRDVSDIRVSTTVRSGDSDALAGQSAMFRDAGIDLLIVSPAHHDPAELDRITEGLDQGD